MTEPSARAGGGDRAFLVFASLFCLASGVRDVVAQAFFDKMQVPLELLLLLGFSATTLFGLVVTWKSGRRLRSLGRQAVVPTLLLNVLTAYSWIAVLAGLRGLLASSLTALLLGTIPLATLALQTVSSREPPPRHDLIGGLVVVAGAALIVYFEGKTDAEHAPKAVLASITGGIAAAATNVTAGKLNKDGATAHQLMSVRFALTLVTAATCFFLFREGTMPSGFPAWLSVVALGLLGFAVPMVAIQKAIEAGGPVGVRTLGFMIACIPILVLMLQSAISPRPVAGKEGALLGAAVVSCGCLLTAWLRRRKASQLAAKSAGAEDAKMAAGSPSSRRAESDAPSLPT